MSAEPWAALDNGGDAAGRVAAASLLARWWRAGLTLPTRRGSPPLASLSPSPSPFPFPFPFPPREGCCCCCCCCCCVSSGVTNGGCLPVQEALRGEEPPLSPVGDTNRGLLAPGDGTLP